MLDEMVERLEARFRPHRDDVSLLRQQGRSDLQGQSLMDYEVTFVGEIDKGENASR